MSTGETMTRPADTVASRTALALVSIHDKPLALRRRAAIIGVTISWSMAAMFLALAIHSL